jgi:ABC-type transporter Mla subunit MlaD
MSKTHLILPWPLHKIASRGQVEKLAIALTVLNANFNVINAKLEKIMSEQDDAAQALEDLSGKLDKIGGETSALVSKVDELEAAAKDAGKLSPRLQAAVNAVVQKASVVDDLVKDAAPNAPDTAATISDRTATPNVTTDPSESTEQTTGKAGADGGATEV